MDANDAEKHVEVEGINYYTLLEPPTSKSPEAAAAAPCVLLIHVLMSNLHMWDATVQALHGAGYATLRYDHVGHHNTPPAHNEDANYHLDDLTRHAHQLVKARTGQMHVQAVIGCSIGGVMALRYAMMFPQDVDRVISIAAPGIASPERTKTVWTERIRQFEEDRRTGGDGLCRATVERWFPGGRAQDDGVRAEALTHVQTCSLQGYKLLADAIRGYDYTDEVGAVGKVRCLIVAGDEDGAIDPEHLREVAGKIERAEFELMEMAGHLPPMQRPDRFNGMMLQSLRG